MYPAQIAFPITTTLPDFGNKSDWNETSCTWNQRQERKGATSENNNK